MRTYTNRVPNPSFEVDLTGWSSYATAPTMERITTDASVGSACFRLTRTVAGGFQGMQYWDVLTVTPSVVHTLSAAVKAATSAILNQARITIEWRTAANAVISSQNIEVSGAGIAAGAWGRARGTVTAPGTAARARVILVSKDGAIGDVLLWDAVLLHEGTEPIDYFDGDSAYASWSGADHASESTIALPILEFSPGLLLPL